MVTSALFSVIRIVDLVQIKFRRSFLDVDILKWSDVALILKNSSVENFVRRPEIVGISVHCKFCTSYLIYDSFIFIPY